MSVLAHIFRRAQTHMPFRFWHVASWMALVLILSLSGCLLQRLYTLRGQICAFEDNFQIRVYEGLRLSFLMPVLLDKDVVWLAGAEPTHVKAAENAMLMSYVLVKEGASHRADDDIPIQLRFLQLDGAFKLKEIHVDRDVTRAVTPELIRQGLRSVCNAEKSIVGRSVTFDLTDLDRALLLTRSEIIEMLGKPNRIDNGEHMISYTYKLRNNDKVRKRSQIDAYFNPSGSEILRVKVRSLRYHLDADFVTGKAVLKVKVGKKSKI